MGRLKRYLTWEKETLKATHHSVERQNRATLLMLLSCMVVAYFGFLVVSLFKQDQSSYQAFFAFKLLYMGVCLLLVAKTPSLPANYLTYGVYVVTVLLCIHASAFVDPDYINTEAYVFFLLFPVLHISSSVWIDAASTLLAVVYLRTITQYKSGKPLALETFSIVGFSLLGMAVGHFVRVKVLHLLLEREERLRAERRDPLLGLPNYKALLQDLAGQSSQFEAVAYLQVRELASPAVFFGLYFEKAQLLALGTALRAAAQKEGIDLYFCGGGMVGLMQPRMLEGIFQRLEPLYQTLNGFAYRPARGEAVPLHFVIGVCPCQDRSVKEAFQRASEVCRTQTEQDRNRILMEDQ